ncbi:MAG: hypothetical protein ACYDA4_04150 [Ignavibacteriaceae bacterium]
MYTQINLPAKGKIGVLLQQVKLITFQKEKPNLYKLLDYSSIITTMNYTHILNIGLGVKSPSE